MSQFLQYFYNIVFKGNEKQIRYSDIEMEKQMTKPVFSSAGISGDFKTPAKTPWGASLRLPMTVTVPAADGPNKGRVTVKLGVSCDNTALVWPNRNVTDLGLELPSALWTVKPEKEFELVLENPTTRPLQLSEGTAVLDLHFMTSVEFDVKR